MMKIIIGNDHNGYELKEELLKRFSEFEIINEGINDKNSFDYPLIAKKVCDEVLKDKDNLGILICGTGIGMSIAANKIKGIRCAHVTNVEEAKLSKMHNNANVIAISGKLNFDEAYEIINAFINTPFSNEERHIRRNNEISELE